MLNANQPFPVVLTVDPAVDTEAMGSIDVLLDYVKSRDFAKIAPYLKPGSKPMVFNLRRCARSQVTYIQAATSAFDRQTRAFACCVAEIENFVTPDGAVVDKWRPASANPSRPDQPITLTNDELDLFSPNEIAEIGAVAETRSFLAPRYAPRFVLPPGLVDTLTVRSYLRAEPSPAQESNTEASFSTRSEPSTSSSSAAP